MKDVNSFFSKECKFLKSAASIDDLPHLNFPEVAFVGRSNVGKSSLINAITGRSTLAKVSGTPGRTRLINFFILADRLMLVDLPGYGYAKVSKKESRNWGYLITDYLKLRKQLNRLFLLIDSRHGIKENDLQMMALLDEFAISYQIVLTKADKISNQELNAVLERVREQSKLHPALHPNIIYTSIKDKKSIETLRTEVYENMF